MSSLRSKTYKWPAQVLHLVCLWPHPSAATVLFIWFPAFVPASLNVLGVILTKRTPRLPLPLYLVCCGCRELWILFIFCWDEQVWKTRVCEGGVLKGCERLGVGSPPRELPITGHLLPVWSLKRTTVYWKRSFKICRRIARNIFINMMHHIFPNSNLKFKLKNVCYTQYITSLLCPIKISWHSKHSSKTFFVAANWKKFK